MTGMDHFDKNYKFMIPCSDHAWNLVWRRVDADGNGKCSFAEFLPLCLDVDKLVTKESLNELLRLYDTNHDGYISK
jgi:Ca2+-binding EF-hand superfamily protein